MQQSNAVGGVSVMGDAASGATVTQYGDDGVLVKAENNGILTMYFESGCTPPRKLRVEPWRNPSLEGFHFVVLVDQPHQGQEVQENLLI